MLTLERIRAADELRGQGRFRRTPLLYPTSLNERIGARSRLYLKLEVFQRTGSFKVRGATSKILRLPERERARGIVCASAGNHAQGVALAASAVGAKATVFMPEYSPLTKQAATQGYGAEIVLRGASYDEAFAHAQAFSEERGAVLVHAFDDEDVMAGQGTVALELLDDLPDVAAVVCSVGGGGLISGIAVALKALRPQVKLIGVQAEGADSAVRSFRAGRRMPLHRASTIADGIKVCTVGERCLDVMRARVDEMVTVTDLAICRAMLYLDEHAHISAEPAGAAPVAALLDGALDLPAGPVAAVVSGGNIDTFEKMRYLRRALAEERRHLEVRVQVEDRRGSKPREMGRLFRLLADHEVNVLDVRYRRETPDLPLGFVELEMLLETRGPEHAEGLSLALRAAGFRALGDVSPIEPLRPEGARELFVA